MKHIQAHTVRAAITLALVAGALLAVSIVPTALAQDRRGGDRETGPRREDAAPRREAPPSRDSGPVREAPPTRDADRSREAPPRISEPVRDTPPLRDRAPSRDSAPPRVERGRDRDPAVSDPRPSRESGPAIERGTDRSADRGGGSGTIVRPPSDTYRPDRTGERSGYDRGRPGERSDTGSGRIERRPPSRDDRSDSGQETHGRAPDRSNVAQRSRDDRGDRGIFDRGPRGGNDRVDSGRTGGAPDRAPRTRDDERSSTRSAQQDPGIRVASPRPYRDSARDIFTRSAEGRRYDRGIVLRPAVRVSTPAFGVYFPHGYHFYPYYSHSYVSVDVIVSPYHFYYGVCPPYVYRHYVYQRPPRIVYIEVPVYVGGTYYGYSSGDYYLDSGSWWRDTRNIDSDLRRAIEDLEDAFRYSDIGLLTYLTDANADIAIFSKGRYQYSLRANDYLDMTRDFMVGADTIRFDVFRARRRSNDVCTLSAKHTYRTRDGQTNVVYLSFVLERFGRYWAITQVDTAPDRL